MKSDAPQGGQQNAVPFLKTPAVYTATQRKGSKEKVKVLAKKTEDCFLGLSSSMSSILLDTSLRWGATVGT